MATTKCAPCCNTGLQHGAAVEILRGNFVFPHGVCTTRHIHGVRRPRGDRVNRRRRRGGSALGARDGIRRVGRVPGRVRRVRRARVCVGRRAHRVHPRGRGRDGRGRARRRRGGAPPPPRVP